MARRTIPKDNRDHERDITAYCVRCNVQIFCFGQVEDEQHYIARTNVGSFYATL